MSTGRLGAGDTAIQPTIFDAKADILTATAADTPARLAVGNNGETLVADSSTATGLRWQGNYSAGKNFVINGNMNIAQRGTSLASISTGESYLVDRFALRNNNLGTATYSQETDAPSGFKTSSKILFTTADNAPAASDFAFFRTKFEGQALQSLKKGTASAVATTASFWVKSNVTGTYIFQLYDADNTRSISKSYSISAADTWEKKSITFDGDTTGALDNDNLVSLQIGFGLGAGTDRTSGTLQTTWAANVTANELVGQVNVAATLNNYWMVTGVQWEIGSVATDFQLSSGTLAGELAACQRYYQKSYNQADSPTTVSASGYQSLVVPSNTIANQTRYGTVFLKTTMRTAPTLTIRPYSTPTNTGRVSDSGGNDLGASSGVALSASIGQNSFALINDSGGNLTTTNFGVIFHWEASSEL